MTLTQCRHVRHVRSLSPFYSRLSEETTGQYRHSLQSESNARVNSPGGTQTHVRNSKEPTQYLPTKPVSTVGEDAGGPSGTGLVQASAPADAGKSRGGAGAYEGGDGASAGTQPHHAADKNGSDKSRFTERGIVASILTKIDVCDLLYAR